MTEIFLTQELPDFFCVSEHWLDSVEIQHVTYTNYNVTSYYCRDDDQHHGGVAIYTKSNKDFQEILEIKQLCTPYD